MDKWTLDDFPLRSHSLERKIKSHSATYPGEGPDDEIVIVLAV